MRKLSHEGKQECQYLILGWLPCSMFLVQLCLLLVEDEALGAVYVWSFWRRYNTLLGLEVQVKIKGSKKEPVPWCGKSRNIYFVHINKKPMDEMCWEMQFLRKDMIPVCHYFKPSFDPWLCVEPNFRILLPLALCYPNLPVPHCSHAVKTNIRLRRRRICLKSLLCISQVDMVVSGELTLQIFF